MNTTPTTWTHKGREITFRADIAKFFAVIGKKTLSAPSLDALKKKIDTEVGFEPWPCYIELTGWGSDGPGMAVSLKNPFTGMRSLVAATVIGIEKPTGRMRGGAQWRVTYKAPKGNEIMKMESVVLPQTPEALAAWKLHWETREASLAAEKALEEWNRAKLEPLREAIPFRRAEMES